MPLTNAELQTMQTQQKQAIALHTHLPKITATLERIAVALEAIEWHIEHHGHNHPKETDEGDQ